MSEALPEYFFRVRDSGAQVFRVDAENRNRRMELEPLAVVNLNRDEIRPQGDRALTEADLAAIRSWMDERRSLLAARALDDVQRLADGMNAAAHWAQTRASAAELDVVTDRLLLAMHDLRTVLVRKKSERLRPDR